MNAPGPGAWAQLGDGGDPGARTRQLDGDLKIERPVAGDEEAPASEHAIAA